MGARSHWRVCNRVCFRQRKRSQYDPHLPGMDTVRGILSYQKFRYRVHAINVEGRTLCTHREMLRAL